MQWGVNVYFEKKRKRDIVQESLLNAEPITVPISNQKYEEKKGKIM